MKQWINWFAKYGKITVDEEGEAHMYQPVNPVYGTSKEDAPVNIGGQTPVLKRNALNDLNLAAECVLYFAKTGELYSELKWRKWSRTKLAGLCQLFYFFYLQCYF